MAGCKALFIDDDRALLNALERNLSLDLDLCVAEGGQAAIDLVATEGPFSVVIVDMRMPGMDGIQTIQALREQLPSASYIMLTGNQDTTTAMQAVNDGQVFRFLNKPCEMDELRKAIEAAQKQHELVVAEKELLQETFVGSISFMTDIIEMQSAQFVDTRRMAETMTQLAQGLDMQIGWEERIAARLSLVGLALMPFDGRLRLQSMTALDPAHEEEVNRLCHFSARMIENIPRLERIAKILRHIPKADGWMSVSLHEDLIAATLLRITFYWNMLTFRGLPAATAIQELKQLMPKMTEGVCNALYTLNDYNDEHVPVDLPVDQLVEGMVMYADVINEQGAIVVSKGRRLTQPVIEKLATYVCSVKVVAGSCPEEVLS